MFGSTSVPAGLLGCKGLHRSAREGLGSWALRRAAAIEADDGDVGLWRFGEPLSQLRRFGGEEVRGWLFGDLFDGTGDIADNLATAYRSIGHGWVWQRHGHFAIVLWDRSRRELALYRDGSSAHTLYYHRTANGGLIFADRLALLVACPLVPRRLAPQGLHEYLRFLDISTPNTIYAGVRSTEPDQLCLHDRHGLHQRDRPTAAATPAAPSDLETAATALDQALAEAVAACTAGRDRVVAFLSGGVDSAYLCALCAAAMPGRVEALTVGFADAAADESGTAAAIAAHLGVRHQVLRPSLREHRAAFDALAEESDYPFADPAAAPTLLAFRRARELADIAVDGTGADTLLGIMPARHQRIAVQFAARLPYPLRRAITAAMAPWPGLRDYRPLLDFGDAPEVLIRWGGWTRREIDALCGTPISLDDTRFYRLFKAFAAAQHYERYSALLGSLPDDRIHVAAALTGLRVRFPFFDPRVEALVRGLDRGLRYAGGEHKRVLKHALARRIPRTLWDLPKHGFDFPFEALLAADDHALIRDYCRPDVLRRLGCKHPERLLETSRGFIAGDRRQRFRAWALTVLCAWLGHHGLGA